MSRGSCSTLDRRHCARAAHPAQLCGGWRARAAQPEGLPVHCAQGGAGQELTWALHLALPQSSALAWCTAMQHSSVDEGESEIGAWMREYRVGLLQGGRELGESCQLNCKVQQTWNNLSGNLACGGSPGSSTSSVGPLSLYSGILMSQDESHQ